MAGEAGAGRGGGVQEGLPGGCPEVLEDELLMMLKTYLFRLPGPSGKSESSYTYSDYTVRTENPGPGWNGGGGCGLGVAVSRQTRLRGGIQMCQLHSLTVLCFNRVSDIVMLKSRKLMGGNRLIC